MSGVTLTIDSAPLNGLIQGINDMFGPEALKEAAQGMGGAVRLKLIDHFSELETDSIHHRSADRLGAQHSGFFADAARSVQMPVQEGDGVSISINKLGLSLRYFGGTVTPGKSISWKTGKLTEWLSIPAVGSAYGKRTQEFDFSGRGLGNLHFVYFRPDLAALVENLASVIKRTRSGVYRHVASTIGTVVFWLKKSVTYQADPTVLPTGEEMLNAAVEVGYQFFAEKRLAQLGGEPSAQQVVTGLARQYGAT